MPSGSAKHRSERVVRSSPTRSAAKGHAQKIKNQNCVLANLTHSKPSQRVKLCC
ncbi:MAG: hypothetical protein NZ455_00390 [Bacteroidia bacterium]|nr:hypothetical protein [Bacteroidia bacterium]